MPLSMTHMGLVVLRQGQFSAGLLPNPRHQPPTNPGLIFLITGEMIPEGPVFAGCAQHEEDGAKDHRNESPDRAQGERKRQVGEERAGVSGMPYQSVGT